MYKIFDLQFLGEQDTIAAFVVETSAGAVLIESGPHSTFPQLTKALQSIGYQPSDIKHVLLSHIHFDHAGAAWCFAELGATIYVHPAGAKHLASPEKLYNSAKMIYGERMEALWGLMKPIPEAQIHAPKQGENIEIGDTIFTAWHTPGHASHHIAWQVEETLFTGDVAGVKIQSGNVMPPCPPPDIDIEAWQESIRLMKWLNVKELVLTHFGVITDVDEHLDALEAELLAWAEWIRPFYETNEPQENIIPLFQDFVAQRLAANGIAAEDIPKYEKANPAFMSVAGLIRYWKKRQVV
jgi:glyoxylase-like metal-dependent hydrolase (beta-lactamase superfamily II)